MEDAAETAREIRFLGNQSGHGLALICCGSEENADRVFARSN